MTVAIAWTLAPNNDFAIVHDSTLAVVWDLERCEMVLVTPSGPPPPPPVEVPRQVTGGKGPLLRPDYDHLADLRAGPTGETLRTVRELRESIERTTRQERELVGV